MKHGDARRNIRLTLVFGFSWMLIPVIPVLVPYLLGFGFTMTEFLQLQALFGLAVAVFEVPSGYFADLYGRRKAMLWGSVISALGFTYLIFARSFSDFLVYELLLALGVSLTSGADISLLYDSGKALEEETGATQSLGSDLISKFYFFRLLAEAVSAVCGGVLASISYHTMLVVTAVVCWFPAVVALFITEPPIQRMELKAHRENFKIVLRQLFINDAVLRLMFVNFVVWSLATFSAIWLIQKYWDEQGLSLIWFGVLWGAFQLVAGFTGIVAARIEKYYGVRNLLAFSAFLSILGFVGLGLLPTAVGIFIGALFYVSRGFNQVLYTEAINWRISGEFRATINSLYSLGFRLSFMVLGPLIGLATDKWGASPTLVGLGVFYLILAVVLFIPLSLAMTRTRTS